MGSARSGERKKERGEVEIDSASHFNQKHFDRPLPPQVIDNAEIIYNDKGMARMVNTMGLLDCNVTLPVDCQVSQWSQWSYCPSPDSTESCGSLTRKRSRSVLQSPVCDGKVGRYRVHKGGYSSISLSLSLPLFLYYMALDLVLLG